MDTVRKLLGIPYLDGKDDCYGLVRRYYHTEYGLILRNYARPIGFDKAGLSLLSDHFSKEGFVVVNIPLNQLQPGDAVLMAIASHTANHVGVYVGEGQFLHHLYRRPSELSPLDDRWKARVLYVVRHPDVEEVNNRREKVTSLSALLPPHLRTRVFP